MILSALLTSVGINFALCLLFFILYSVLRNRPSYADFYIPRLVAEGKFQEDDEFSVGKLLSSFKWVKRACQPSEEELLANSGLDAVVFMRIFTFGLKVFRFAGIVGICILLPFNYMGNQLNIDFTDLPNKSLESSAFQMLMMGQTAARLWLHARCVCMWLRLWIHFAAVYIFTAVVCYLLYYEYDYIASKRIAYFYSSKPRPGQFTVLVRSIPATSGRSFGESVESFFSEYYPSTYLSHSVVRRTSKLRGLVNEADKVYKRLVHVKSKKHPQQRFKRAGFMGLFGRKVDLLDHYEKKLEDVEGNVRTERSSIAGKEVPAAFVSFKSRFSAAIVSHVQQGVKPTEWITEQAPDPRIARSYSFGSVGGLVTFSERHIKIENCQPSYIALSQIEKSACIKVLWFTIWNIFFANVLSGSALYRVDVFLEPKRIPELLAVAVPGQASFFIAYVVTSGWTKTFSSELFRLKRLFWSFLKGTLCWKSDEELELLNVYAPKFETGGKFWPVVHDATIFSLILMHVIAIGIFGLKKVPLASSLAIPLPILTLIFNSYCRRRFRPSFKGYPAECLINKDRFDQSDPTMSSFYDELATAYRDPAMKSVRYSEARESSSSPLLYGADK
ncbi:CSC1-like protein HYP1 [Sesamum angolense]|uniref:CSC1-like protein HYP1 n=1 Tax=Sesamum angolense TaxID=2727404 RepID=A0AAE1WGY9_9LAMI|nr:CSC1-like protein HYP1 [Sesamum angolense]